MGGGGGGGWFNLTNFALFTTMVSFWMTGIQ
jgi:hypothetical protein